MNPPNQNNISIPLSPSLEQRLKEVAQMNQKTEQELILEALENHLKQFPTQKSCYDLAIELGVIGVAEDLPSDLSTNPDYFDRFGE
jgi:predicted DNA-binding protein